MSNTETRPADITGTVYEDLDKLRVDIKEYVKANRNLIRKFKRLQAKLNRTEANLMLSRDNNKPALILIELQKEKIERLTGVIEGTNPVAGNPTEWGLKAQLAGTILHRNMARRKARHLYYVALWFLENPTQTLVPDWCSLAWRHEEPFVKEEDMVKQEHSAFTNQRKDNHAS